MAQVPYQPVPTVTPTDRGPGPVSVKTPTLGPEIFGANVGAAMSHLGTTLEGVGTEMYSRAQAFQDLDNHNDATMAAVDFEKAANKMDVDLRSQAGENAVEAYKGYDDRMEQARQDIRARLKNDDARRIFDSQSKGILNRGVWQGGIYASGQHRAYTDSADNAATSLATKGVKIDTSDDTVFDKSMKALEAQVYATGRTKWGTSEEAVSKIEEHWQSVRSTATASAITDLAMANPLAAKTKLDTYNAKGLLQPDDYAKAKEIVNKYINERVPPNILKDIRTGKDIRLGNQKVPIERAGNAVTGVESIDAKHPAGNYDARGPDTPYGRALGRYQVMPAFLQGFLKEAGMAPMSEEEFLKDHAAQDRLFNTIFQKYMDKYGNANDAASMWFSGVPYKQAVAEGRGDHYTMANQYVAKFNAGLARDAKIEEMRKAAMDKGNELVDDKENPLFAQHLQTEVNRQLDLEKKLKVEARFENRNTLAAALSTTGPDGKLVTDMNKLLLDPKAKAAWDGLDPLDRVAVSHKLAKNAHDVYPESESIPRFTDLYGMTQTEEGRNQLVNDVNLLQEHISPFQLQQILNKMKDPKAQNEHLAHAYSILARTIPRDPETGMGVPSSKQKDVFNRFNGELSQWLEDFQTKSGRPANDKEIKAVGQEMIRAMAVDRLHGQPTKPGFFTTTAPAYNVQPPDEIIAKHRAIPGHENDSMETIRRSYIRNYLNKLTGIDKDEGKGKGGTVAGGGG